MKGHISIKNIILLVIFCILVSGITYFVMLNIKENNNVNKNSENLVLDYNKFYTLEGIMKKIVKYINDEDYDSIDKLLDEECEISILGVNAIIEEYKRALSEYNDLKYLVSASIVNDNVYLCEFEVAGYRQNIKIKLNEKENTFTILNLKKWGYTDD